MLIYLDIFIIPNIRKKRRLYATITTVVLSLFLLKHCR